MNRSWMFYAISSIVLFGGYSPLASATPADEAAGAQDMSGMDMSGMDMSGDYAHKNLIVLEKVAEVPASFTAGLDAAYSSYLAVAAALVADDAAAADAAASKMREIISGLDAAGLSGEASEAWTGHEDVLKTSLNQLTSAQGLESKREHFSHATEAMYCALRSFGGLEHAVNVNFCPMAFGGKGANWLATDSTIANPYLGSEMATCGEHKETIN